MTSFINRRSVVLTGMAAGLLGACQEDGKVRPGRIVEGRSMEAMTATSMTAGQFEAQRRENLAALDIDARRTLLSGFAVNVEMWWTDVAFEDRFEKARDAGFTHVEFWRVGRSGRDAKAIAKLCQDLGLNVSQIVADTPELGAGNLGVEFKDSSLRAIEEAQILGAPVVTITGHRAVEGVAKSTLIARYQGAMEAAYSVWDEAKIYAAIEPFNPFNHPGHFIYGHIEALEICRAVEKKFGAKYIKMNWDLFHMQRSEGNVIANLQQGIDQVCYMQLADSPDRHQPSTGEMDYVQIISAARAAGYVGPIGLECVPKNKDNEAAILDILQLSEDVAETL